MSAFNKPLQVYRHTIVDRNENLILVANNEQAARELAFILDRHEEFYEIYKIARTIPCDKSTQWGNKLIGCFDKYRRG